jgi:hypothetical protein
MFGQKKDFGTKTSTDIWMESGKRIDILIKDNVPGDINTA